MSKKPCIMMAIDSSTKKSGIAIFENGILKNHFVINFEKEKVMDNRFELMSRHLIKTLTEFHPDIVYIEETVVLRNAQTQRFLTRLQGVIYGWCVINDCEFNTVRPTTWRKSLNFEQGKNKKRDDLKEQGIEFVRNQYNIEVSDDEADAICIGHYAIHLFENAIPI